MAEASGSGSSKVHLEIHHDGPFVRVTFPTGRIDGAAVNELSDGAAQLVGGMETRLLVDLTGVNYVNSAAVGIMVTLKRRAMQEGAQFHLAIPAQTARQVFNEMRLDKVLDIF